MQIDLSATITKREFYLILDEMMWDEEIPFWLYEKIVNWAKELDDDTKMTMKVGFSSLSSLSKLYLV